MVKLTVKVETCLPFQEKWKKVQEMKMPRSNQRLGWTRTVGIGVSLQPSLISLGSVSQLSSTLVYTHFHTFPLDYKLSKDKSAALSMCSVPNK